MTAITHHDMPEDKCSSCGKLFGAATSFTTAEKPKPGDVTICIQCGHIMAFDEDLKMRELNDEEIKTIAGNREILVIQKARALAMKEHDEWKT